MRHAFFFKARKAGDWAEFLENSRISACSNVKLRECCTAVEPEDEDRKSIAQITADLASCS